MALWSVFNLRWALYWRKKERKVYPKPNYAMQQSDNLAPPPLPLRIVKESEPESVRNCAFSNVTGEVSKTRPPFRILTAI